MITSINGKICHKDQALIPVIDHGLLYGDGIFEGIRIYNRRIFRFEDHLHRLQTAARAIHLKLPGGIAAIREQVIGTVREFAEDNGYIRLLVTRGDGALGIDPSSCGQPRVICIVDRIQIYSVQKQEQGINLITASIRRAPVDVLDPRVKSLNYLNSILARMEANRQHADEALLLNKNGMVAETTVANIFAVHKGTISTPPAIDGALEGITRKTILELSQNMQLSANERSLAHFDLISADEVFLTGTGARIVKVRSLDGEIIGDPQVRPVTDSLMAAFEQATQTMGTPVD